MKVGSTITMCIIAICGVIAAGAVEYFDTSRGAEGATGVRRLLAADVLPTQLIERITLTRADETPVVLERNEAGWQQTAPFEYPLNPVFVEKMIKLLTELEVVDVIDVSDASASSTGDARAPGGTTLAVLGLDPPHARLTLDWPGGTMDVRLGRRGIAGRAYLALDANDTVHVVNQDLHEAAIDIDVKEWRDRRIFRNVGVDSDSIEIISGDSTIRLVQDRKKWTMESPVRSRLDELALDVLFQALGRATSSGFILDQPPDLAQFGLQETAGTVTVTTTRVVRTGDQVAREPETQRLRIGARIGVGTQDRFGFVEGRDVVVRISEPVLQALFRPVSSLLANTASAVVPADVKSIRVKVNAAADGSGASDFLIERTLDGWIAPERSNRPVPAARVNGLLETLTSLRATEVSVQPYTRELEVAIITLFDFGGKPIDTVRVAREGPDGRWALENGDNVFRIFPERLLLPLRPVEFGLLD